MLMFSFKMTKKEALDTDLNEALLMIDNCIEFVKIGFSSVLSMLFPNNEEDEGNVINEDGLIILNDKDKKIIEELNKKRGLNNG